MRGPGASQVCYKHPWGAKTHALAILLLPRAVRDLFEDDRVAHRHDLMDLALLPHQLLLAAALLDPTLGVIVVRVGHAPLPIHVALQAAHLLLVEG